LGRVGVEEAGAPKAVTAAVADAVVDGWEEPGSRGRLSGVSQQ